MCTIPSHLEEAVDVLNADNPTHQHHMPLMKSLARLKDEELTEYVFCGIVNNIRFRHPTVTKTFAPLWYLLAKVSSRANSSMRYPATLAKVRSCFDKAVLFRFTEEDTDEDDFDVGEWMEQHVDAIKQVLDIRMVRSIFEHESDDWKRIIDACNHLGQGSPFAKIALLKVKRRAMQEYIKQATQREFESTLLAKGKMTVDGNIEACERIRANMEEAGVVKELSGPRSVELDLSQRHPIIVVRNVQQEIDSRFGCHLRDAARNYGLLKYEYETYLIGDTLPTHPFGRLVGMTVLQDINKMRKRMGEDLDPKLITSSKKLKLAIDKNQPKWTDIETSADLDTALLQDFLGENGAAAVKEMVYKVFPTAMAIKDPSVVYTELGKLLSTPAVKLGGAAAANHVTNARTAVLSIINLEVPSHKLLTGSPYMQKIATLIGNFVEYEDMEGTVTNRYVGKTAITRILAHLWADIESPDSVATSEDLHRIGPFKFLMNIDDVDRFNHVKAVMDENTAAKIKNTRVRGKSVAASSAACCAAPEEAAAGASSSASGSGKPVKGGGPSVGKKSVAKSLFYVG